MGEIVSNNDNMTEPLVAELLRTRLDKARIEARKQTEAFEAFTQEQGEQVEGWRAMVHAFEDDPKKQNPYAMKVTRKWTAFYITV